MSKKINQAVLAAKTQLVSALEEFLNALCSGEAEAAPEEPEKPADGLDDEDRASLKEIINNEELGIAVTKAMDDDVIRAAIREARGAGAAEATPAEAPPKKATTKKTAAAPAEEAEDTRSMQDQLKSVLKKVMANLGREAVIKILKKFGAEAISDVPADKAPAAIKEAEKALAAAG